MSEPLDAHPSYFLELEVIVIYHDNKPSDSFYDLIGYCRVDMLEVPKNTIDQEI